jgi:sirohydrochlorin ferrochelatase
MKTALLVLVHGSPNTAANDDMFRVLELIRGRGDYDIAEAGFLECNEPDIPSSIDRCVSMGADEVVAVPYFLHTGNHVADDLPTLLEAAREKYPLVRFRLADFLGRSPLLTEILASRALEAL